MNPVRFGSIGAGMVARDFAEGLRGVSDAALTVVWSRSSRPADGFLARFPGTRVVSDVGKLVTADDVDVVYLATPHHRHAPDSLLAFRSGKPVLCEKPFAMSAVVALTIVEEARARNFSMEAMWMRCIPAIRRAKVLVDQGVIGEPRMLFADFGVTTPYDPTSRFFDSAQGGGALLDRGVYAVSLAHLLLGAVMRFPQGQLAVLAAALGTTTPNAQ